MLHEVGPRMLRAKCCLNFLSVIIRDIAKLGEGEAQVQFVNNEYDHRPTSDGTKPLPNLTNKYYNFQELMSRMWLGDLNLAKKSIGSANCPVTSVWLHASVRLTINWRVYRPIRFEEIDTLMTIRGTYCEKMLLVLPHRYEQIVEKMYQATSYLITARLACVVCNYWTLLAQSGGNERIKLSKSLRPI